MISSRAHRPAALVVGPTRPRPQRRYASTSQESVGNRVASIPHALNAVSTVSGTTVSSNGALNDPLGLAIAPDGDILTTNGGHGNLVETYPTTHAQVALKTLDTTPAPPGPNGNGALFGLAITPDQSGVYYVDDATNTQRSNVDS